MRLKGLLMRLKQLKIYNLTNLIFYFFLISGISFNALACEDIIFSKKKVSITSKKNNKKHKFNVEIADTKQKREIGLQCKKKLKNFEGMLFSWSEEDLRYFWMKNTNFFLDLIFINSEFEIIDIFYNAKPYSLNIISSKKKAKYVLELKKETLKKLDIIIGDKIDIQKN